MILLCCRGFVEIGRSLIFIVMMMVVCGIFLPAPANAETKIIPSAGASGRYDSNVFRRPEQFLPAGTQTEDYVTTVGGAVDLLHETRDINASFKVGGSYNAFIENTGLNFFTANVDGLASRDRVKLSSVSRSGCVIIFIWPEGVVRLAGSINVNPPSMVKVHSWNSLV